MLRPAIATPVVLAALLTAAGSHAQSTSVAAGGGVQSAGGAIGGAIGGAAAAATATDRTAPPRSDADERLRWRRTWFVWDNAVTTQTVGVGKSFQSLNPTYESTLSLRPRYYLYDGDIDAIYAEGRIDVTGELTNSDVTTTEHETTLSDATLLTGYSRLLAARGDYETLFGFLAPILTFPTSTFSRDNGTILGLGSELRLSQAVPLSGRTHTFFQRIIFRAAAGYNHTFTTAVVPTNPELRRVRLDPSGRTVPGDQLTGAAFPEHELHFDARALLEITPRIGIWSEVSYRPTWKYGFSDVCVATSTGCAIPEKVDDPSRYVVVTSFQAEVYYSVIQELGLSLGYVNVELQPGPDGNRRSIFYSPGAQFYVDVTAYLDAIYLAAVGRRTDPPDGLHLRP